MNAHIEIKYWMQVKYLNGQKKYRVSTSRHLKK